MTRIEYVNDCHKIQLALLHEKNWEATLAECQELWSYRSDKWDMIWMSIDGMTDIVKQIEEFCDGCPSWDNRIVP